LDTAATPSQIVIRTKFDTLANIYRLDGDTLVLAASAFTPAVAPAEFKLSEEVVVANYQRVKP
jgi:hypothetical protein